MGTESELSHFISVVCDAAWGTAPPVVPVAHPVRGAVVPLALVPAVRDQKEVKRLVKEAAQPVKECAAETIDLQNRRLGPEGSSAASYCSPGKPERSTGTAM